jgi:hypothetical protein
MKDLKDDENTEVERDWLSVEFSLIAGSQTGSFALSKHLVFD